MSQSKLEDYIVKGVLRPQKGRRPGCVPSKGIVSKGSNPDTAFIDLVVEYNPETGNAFMTTKAPLPLRIDLEDISLESALHIAAESAKIAFNSEGAKLGRFVAAYSRDDRAVSQQGTIKETYWMRYNI